MKKSSKAVIAVAVAVVPAILLIVVNTINHFLPATLDADYLSEAVMYAETFDDPVFSDELGHGGGVICLATVANEKNNVGIIYLEKDGGQYNCKFHGKIDITTLQDDETQYEQIVAVNSCYKDEAVIYSVFANPTDDSVVINENEVPVQKITFDIDGHTRVLGYWSAVVPKEALAS